MGTHGMVASSQPLASQVGLSILMQGGNAADAAVATAAALNVTEPCSTGLGGDCFALYFEGATNRITALNASGRAPRTLSIDRLEREGLARVWHQRHAHTVTVPGACSGWCTLIEHHGSMPIATILAPAIQLAEEGYPVGPIVAHHWKHDERLLQSNASQELLIDGRAPRPGERFRNPTLGRTLRTIAAGGAEAFYHGETATRIAGAVQQFGGTMDVDDLASHEANWETPISTVFRDVRVWECPPNGQGLAALLALNFYQEFPQYPPLSVERLHLQIEAMRVAFADADWYVADPQFAPAPLDLLLSRDYAAERRSLIDPGRALGELTHGIPALASDTVYFCVVDGNGNACSFINSNYNGFGTGIVPEGCGFSLQNRGFCFSIQRGHPNALAPGKRPYHTIIPGMLTHLDGSLYGPFGVMGGFMQPQGHFQVLVNMLDDEMDPQTALDHPRFCVSNGGVYLEPTLPMAGLAARGHNATLVGGYDRAVFGRGQVIVRQPDGILIAGSDMRSDGCAMGW